jgi:imidazoleglycerol-phosphate dehydratase
MATAPRTASLERRTTETTVAVRLVLDGTGESSLNTGLGFLDHMLGSLARHARFDLELSCDGDLDIDDHHTVEDVALTLGQALDAALGERRGIARFGTGFAPLDEALARCVVDLSGRPSPHVDLGLSRDMVGEVAAENLEHFFASFATAARMALHLDLLRGRNDHHRAEAAFKALALALRAACAPDPSARIPSTKGVM